MFQLPIRGRPDICISTPLGLLSIRVTDDKKKVVVRMPESMTAHRGFDRAANSSKYVELQNGHARPKYKLLKPVVDDDGNVTDLIGVNVLKIGT